MSEKPSESSRATLSRFSEAGQQSFALISEVLRLKSVPHTWIFIVKLYEDPEGLVSRKCHELKALNFSYLMATEFI